MIVSSVETAVIVVFAVLCPTVSVGHELDATSTSTVVYEAVLNLTYWDRATGEWRSRDGARGPPVGIYAVEGRAEPEWGRVIHVRTADNRTDGCVSPVVSVPPPSERWIALVQKGNCGIQQKISNTAAAIANISAVVIYGHDLDSEPQLYRGRGMQPTPYPDRKKTRSVLDIRQNQNEKQEGRLCWRSYLKETSFESRFESALFIKRSDIAAGFCCLLQFMLRLRILYSVNQCFNCAGCWLFC